MPIPSRAEFQTATDLKFVVADKRAADMVLNRIDVLIDEFHAEPSAPGQAILLARIYYATEAWMKKVERGEPGVNGRRKPAVYNFYVTVVQALSSLTEVPINLLPNWLAETFGKAMVEHGAQLDITRKLADYLTGVDVKRFRISLRSGIAYQQRWWTNSDKWVVASSANVVAGTTPLKAIQGNVAEEVIAAGFSGYVLSQGGDFYSGPHFAPRQKNSEGMARYHSSYFGGEPVLSAGEIKIEDGKVTEINSSSGHYQPSPTHLRMAVETLALQGVSMATLWVGAFGLPRMLGAAYLGHAGLAAVPVDRGMGVARPGWALSTGGNTPASRAWATATMSAHASMPARNREILEKNRAFVLFELHCKPRSDGGLHGPGGRGKCLQCKEIARFWDAYLEYKRK